MLEKRISLRKLTSADLDHFYLWASDLEVTKTMAWDAYQSKEEAKYFLKNHVDHHPCFYAICLDNIPIGSITLNQGQVANTCRAELGYVLAKSYWSKGITTIAVKKMLTRGFQELSICRIEALVHPQNLASQKVLINSGMHLEGYLKKYLYFKGIIQDRLLYSITQ